MGFFRRRRYVADDAAVGHDANFDFNSPVKSTIVRRLCALLVECWTSLSSLAKLESTLLPLARTDNAALMPGLVNGPRLLICPYLDNVLDMGQR